jgi:hypothetical protein
VNVKHGPARPGPALRRRQESQEQRQPLVRAADPEMLFAVIEFRCDWIMLHVFDL